VICLTSEQCSEWLKQHGISEAPYGSKLARGVYYLQFAPPRNAECRVLVASLLNSLGSFAGGLLQLTDWIWDSEQESDPTAALRKAHGEHRSLLDAPGFLFDQNEESTAIDLGSLILERGWTGYLYLGSKIATLLLWEGDLIDFWSKDKRATEQIRTMLQSCGTRILHDHAQ